MASSLTAKECPYTGPYSLPSGPHRSRGPTAKALKIAMKRMGQAPFAGQDNDTFDEHYNDNLEKALDRTTDPAWSGYGEKRWEAVRQLKIPAGAHNSGEWALNKEARDLILLDYAQMTQPAPSPEPDDPLKIFRQQVTDFCNQGLAKPGIWNYIQNRPVDVTVNPSGSATINSDCSGSVIQATHYAKQKTGLKIQDPAKQGWSGYGNTDLYEDDWPTVTGSYQVGDLAHYQGHVTLCMKAGDWSTSDWWSFGSEPPSRRKLNYRSDFRKVVRPVYLS